MPIKVAVIGAGSWGTTVAALAAVNEPTVLWARRPELARSIERDRTNRDYLPGVHLPDELTATASLAEAVGPADLVVMAVPSHGYRSVAAAAAPHIRAGVPVVSLAKGIEASSLQRMTEVTLDELPDRPAAVLTGPNLAREILAGQPAASVVAVGDTTVAAWLQRIFGRRTMRIYTNPDVVGCEIGGAAKNVIAIAAGMATGMGFGDNTRASLVTRGLAEITRLGLAMGAQVSTFAGLAGIGDLIATCASPQSRNATVGVQLGRGRTIDQIVGSMTMVAEGVRTSSSVLALARRYGVDMPVTEQVVAVCHEGRTAAAALDALLEREHTREFDH